MPKKFLLFWLALALAWPLSAKDKFQTPGPVQLDHEGDNWARKTLKHLSLEEKIGQMIMIWARVEFTNLDSYEYVSLRDDMRKYHIGSLLLTVPQDGSFLLRNQPYEAAMLVNQLQHDSELPLIFAADFERGLSMRLHGVTPFPAAMAFGADGKIADVEAFGRITAEESRAIGVQWNFFPVADINSNPLNPIINTRAFGEDPDQVGDLVAAYIRGAHEAGMLTTAKHFPGHGDTATDSHLGLARVDLDLPHLEKFELPPFQKAINAGVDSVMIAHLTIPALIPDSGEPVVATTSKAVVTDLLKGKMGFQGLVVTDAMEMNALMRLFIKDPNPSGAAAVAAVKAGNDMILIPSDLDGTYNGLLNAVRKGEIPESQIDESVLKILRAKAAVGLHKARLVDINNLAKVVDKPENIAIGQQIAASAVTLLRDNGQVLPLKRVKSGTAGNGLAYSTTGEDRHNGMVAVIFSDDVRFESGRIFERELKARAPGIQVFYVDPRIASGMSAQVLAAVQQAQQVVVGAYVVPSSGKIEKVGNEMKNTVSLGDATANLLHQILQSAGPRTVVLAMGNPYIAADFPEVQNYLCTFSNVPVSEIAAVKALFGEIPIQGHVPVTIPNIAARGAGIQRPPQTAQGGSYAHRKTVR